LGRDVSPIPLKELDAASQTVPSLVQFVRKYGLTVVEALRVFGFGWRTITWLNKPLGKLSSGVRLILLGLSLPHDAASADEFFNLGLPRMARYKAEASEVIQKFASVEIVKARFKLERQFTDLTKVNAVSWAGRCITDLVRLLKSELSSFTERLSPPERKEELSPSPGAQKALRLANAISTMDQYAGWTLFLDIIQAVWEPTWNIANQKIYDLRGQIPHTDGVDYPHILYFKYIQFLKEWNNISLLPFSETRPNGLEEALENNFRATPLTPVQIRLWRKWSGIFQGSQDVQSIGPKLNPDVADIGVVSPIPPINSESLGTLIPNQDW
jgi:hypothetical protein